eukprot:m.167768 g.167768  ORF g.167768 m.167768 type:complete len:366 (+) comp15308_c0_seq16:131-1228(+)
MASASETPPNSEELISTFQEVAGITDAEQAKRLLVDFGWDLSVAVENYLAMTSTEEHADSKSTNTETDSTLRRRAVGNPKTPPEEVQAQPAQPNDNNPGWWQWFVGILLTPFRALFRPIFDVLVGFFSSLIPGTLMMDSAKPGKLQESLQEEYGQSPRLFRTSLNEALSHAKKELKFMLIYIHQPDHPDTPRMCRDVIANADFISFINDNVIFWGETAACRQGRQVARSLRASDRPLLALVSLLNGQMRVIFRNLGYIQREELMSKLVIHMEQYQPALIGKSKFLIFTSTLWLTFVQRSKLSVHNVRLIRSYEKSKIKLLKNLYDWIGKKWSELRRKNERLKKKRQQQKKQKELKRTNLRKGSLG